MTFIFFTQKNELFKHHVKVRSHGAAMATLVLVFFIALPHRVNGPLTFKFKNSDQWCEYSKLIGNTFPFAIINYLLKRELKWIGLHLLYLNIYKLITVLLSVNAC